MAIDNLDFVCSKKPENSTGGLNYVTTQIFTELPKLTNFDKYIAREQVAKKQLLVIGRYLKDFKSIIQKLTSIVTHILWPFAGTTKKTLYLPQPQMPTTL